MDLISRWVVIGSVVIAMYFKCRCSMHRHSIYLPDVSNGSPFEPGILQEALDGGAAPTRGVWHVICRTRPWLQPADTAELSKRGDRILSSWRKKTCANSDTPRRPADSTAVMMMWLRPEQQFLPMDPRDPQSNVPAVAGPSYRAKHQLVASIYLGDILVQQCCQLAG